MMSGAWPPPAPSVWIGVDGAALERGDRVLDEAGLVERVGVDGDLHVVRLGDAQAAVDGRRRRAPVLVQLEPDGAGDDLLDAAPPGRLALPLPRRPMFIGSASAACSMRAMFQGPGVQVVALVPVAGPVPPPIIVVTPRHQRVLDLLRADEVDVRVDAARR